MLNKHFSGLPPEIEENFYPLPTGYPHGLCIIINVKDFMKPRGDHDNVSTV